MSNPDNLCGCGHAVWWHHTGKGCGERGCPCPLLMHEAVDYVVFAAQAAAWQEGAQAAQDADPCGCNLLDKIENPYST